jgi:hypothetical protein
MKRFAVILTTILLLVVSCGPTKRLQYFEPRYSSGQNVDVYYIIDSVVTADNLNMVDIDKWLKSNLITNKGAINIMTYDEVKDKRMYILTVIQTDSLYYYKYRVE